MMVSASFLLCLHGVSFSNLFAVLSVLFGRGAPVIQNEGNMRFREIVESRKVEYSQAQRRNVKDTIARQISQEVARRGGKFVSRVTTLKERKRLGAPEDAAVWVIVDEEVAVEKCKQTLREKLYDRADKSPVDASPSPVLQGESTPKPRSEDSRRAASAPSNVPQPNWGVLSATMSDQGPVSSGSMPSFGQGRQIASLLGSRSDQMALLTQMQRDHITASFEYQQLTSGPNVNNGHTLALLQNVLDRDLQRIQDIGSFSSQQQHLAKSPGSNIDPLAEDMLRRHEAGRAIRSRQQIAFLAQQAMDRQPQPAPEIPAHPNFGPQHRAGLEPNLAYPLLQNAFGLIPHTTPPPLAPVLPSAAGLCASLYQFQSPPSGSGGEIDLQFLALLGQRQNQDSLLATAIAAGISSRQSNPAANDAIPNQASKQNVGAETSLPSEEEASATGDPKPSARKKRKLLTEV